MKEILHCALCGTIMQYLFNYCIMDKNGLFEHFDGDPENPEKNSRL